MNRGVFISVDGPNGVGKSTFIRELSDLLTTRFSVYMTKEPSPTLFGDFVRKNEANLRGLPYAHLICSDRYYHINSIVLPQIENGSIVITDRYIESSFVLQGFDGVPTDEIWRMNKDFPIPDISVILLAQEDLLEERLSKRTELTAFEKRMTRDQEIHAYRQTVSFLQERGFNYIVCNNDSPMDFEKNINIVFEKICSIMG